MQSKRAAHVNDHKKIGAIPKWDIQFFNSINDLKSAVSLSAAFKVKKPFFVY